ncbi:hypothetical protein OF83DRAFT_819672 [Amylostereum chailletii]|nr:hypothetical protein OF83DRAFT_819672 [Amylostereum chailletii]
MHAIEVLVKDNVLWVYWFDRQGAIQTCEMDLIQDLPRFLVLLLSFQRFNNSNWGVPDGFPEHLSIERDGKLSSQGAASASPPANTVGRYMSIQEPVARSELFFPQHSEFLVPSKDPDKPNRTITTLAKSILVHWNKPIHTRYQLFGRATQVYFTTEEGLDDELIVKISFPDKSRVSESRIIRIAQHAEVEENKTFNVEDHLPKLFCTMDVPGSDKYGRYPGKRWLAEKNGEGAFPSPRRSSVGLRQNRGNCRRPGS